MPQEFRKQIKKEVEEDLSKSYKQSLIDIHEELLYPERSTVDNIRHCIKRMSSLFAKMGMDNQKTQKRINTFTIIVGVFTIVNVVVYLLALLQP